MEIQVMPGVLLKVCLNGLPLAGFLLQLNLSWADMAILFSMDIADSFSCKADRFLKYISSSLRDHFVIQTLDHAPWNVCPKQFYCNMDISGDAMMYNRCCRYMYNLFPKLRFMSHRLVHSLGANRVHTVTDFLKLDVRLYTVWSKCP